MYKVIFTALLAIFLGSTAVAQEGVTTTIREVMVFRQSAQITRTGEANLTAGRGSVVLTGLSPQLDASSVRLGATGEFTILSIQHRNNFLEAPADDPEITGLEEEKTTLERELAREQIRIDVLQEEEKLLLANRSIGSEQTGVDVSELQNMAAYLSERLQTIRLSRLELTEAMADRKERIQQIAQQLNEMRRGQQKNVGEVVVQYQADRATRSEFQLTYLVNGAGWTPAYDLRVAELTEPVNLTYGARIAQSTGEDWENVQLTLSTGNPRQQQNAPVVRTWWLSPGARIAGARDQATNYYLDGISLSNASVPMERAEADAEFAGADVNINLTNTEFEVRLAQDIPSDGQQYQVVVDDYELPADYQYYAAPKFDCHVYLTARVTDWEKYSLLPGQVNLFFDGAFIGKSHLNTQAANDTLVFSLGRDEGISIQRDREENFRNRRFLGSKVEQRLGWTITVQKNRRADVPIVIEDQIPVSTTDEIEVELEQRGGANYDESTGMLRWEINLGFGESEELGFRYSVKYPKQMTLYLE